MTRLSAMLAASLVTILTIITIGPTSALVETVPVGETITSTINNGIMLTVIYNITAQATLVSNQLDRC